MPNTILECIMELCTRWEKVPQLPQKLLVRQLLLSKTNTQDSSIVCATDEKNETFWHRKVDTPEVRIYLFFSQNTAGRCSYLEWKFGAPFSALLYKKRNLISFISGQYYVFLQLLRVIFNIFLLSFSIIYHFSSPFITFPCKSFICFPIFQLFLFALISVIIFSYYVISVFVLFLLMS